MSFEDAHTDTGEGHLLSVQMVKDVVAQMEDVAAAQRVGLVEKGARSAEKRGSGGRSWMDAWNRQRFEGNRQLLAPGGRGGCEAGGVTGGE